MVAWAVLRDNEGAFSIECLQRTYDVPEIGSRVGRARSIHRFSADGMPVGATFEDSDGNRSEIEITSREVRLGDAVRSLDGSIDVILDGAAVPITAYLLLMSPFRTRYALNALVAGTGECVPYVLERNGGALKTNFGDTYVLGEDGLIDAVRPRVSEVSVRRIVRRVPRWPSSLGERRYRYIPPSDLKVVDLVSGEGETEADATVVRLEDVGDIAAAAVFVGGTGMYDRHGIAAHLDLGYHRLLDDFARNGIASLRYERYSAAVGPDAPSDLDALCLGAMARLDQLAAQEWARGKPLVLIGHSLGGIVALKLSENRPDLGAVVLLATPGRTLRKVTDDQFSWLQSHLDLSEESRSEQCGVRRRLVAALESDAEWTAETVPPEVLAAKAQRPLLKSLLDFDPARSVIRGKCPVIIVQGSRDVQVAPSDARLLAAAAQSAGREVRLIEIPELNHFLRRDARDGPAALRDYADRRRRTPIALVRTIAKAISELS